MRKLLSVTLLITLILVGCEDGAMVDNLSKIGEVRSGYNPPRCPRINYIVPGGERSSPSGGPYIEVCYDDNLTSSSTSYELFFRRVGDGDNSWKSLGDGYGKCKYNELAGGCSHVFYEISFDSFVYRQSYEFKAGPKDEASTIYRYYHYKKAGSNYNEYDCRYVTLFLEMNIPDNDNYTYSATITMTDNFVLPYQPGVQSETFYYDFSRIFRSQIFETSFYCLPTIGRNTCGTIVVEIRSENPRFSYKRYTYEYTDDPRDRYITHNISVNDY